MRLILLILLLGQQTMLEECGKSIYVPDLPEEHYSRHGDFYIGVLLPVHVRDTVPFCGANVHDLGLLQRLEAMVFAVDEVNRDILSDYSLGFVMFDDCYTDLIALAQGLHFAKTAATCHSNCNENMPALELYDIIGLIGSESSITTTQVANLMSTFKIPQVSYFATSPALSNPIKYPMFQRTVPSDITQARVILELLTKFNWTFVYVVYSEGAYGEGLYRAMERVIQEDFSDRDICFAEPKIIRQDFSNRDYDTLVWNMLFEKAANVSLLIAPGFEAWHVMAACRRMLANGRITWIASDAWARSIHNLQDIMAEAHGLISINIHSANVQRFDKYFQSKRIIDGSDNPWFEEFIKQYFNCTIQKELDSGIEVCPDHLTFADHARFAPEATNSLVFDAVKTYALALEQQIQSCRDMAAVDMQTCVKQNFSKVLKDTVFVGEAEDIISFDSNGDREASYDVFNLQKCENCTFGYSMVRIGEWNQYSRALDVDLRAVEWALGYKPLSNCSRQCGVGEGMELQQKRCCWTCIPCAENQFTRVTFGDVKRCFACPKNKWPDIDTRTECIDISPEYITVYDAVGISLVSIATSGICFSLLILITYVLNNKHQLIKACSRELSYTMLIGITASFCMVFTLVVKPSSVTCIASEIGIAVVFTVVYAPLCIKTIRIWRIFEAGRQMNRKPRCVTSMSQVSIVSVIVSVHALIMVIWSIFEPPVEDGMVTGPGKIELICRFPVGPFVFTMIIEMLLVLVCSVFAFKTRKLPDNFNESRFISFCAFSTAVLWLAFTPSYFLTESSHRALFLALMLCANGFIFLGGFFMPKIFAIYFVNKSDLHLRFIGGRLSIAERSQVSHIGHFLQDTGHANFGSHVAKQTIPETDNDVNDGATATHKQNAAKSRGSRVPTRNSRVAPKYEPPGRKMNKPQGKKRINVQPNKARATSTPNKN